MKSFLNRSFAPKPWIHSAHAVADTHVAVVFVVVVVAVVLVVVVVVVK